MRYAEVSVNSPGAQRRTFSYAIPPHLNVEAGQAVWVPFGEKKLQGVVLEINPLPSVEETRDISDVIESQPVLSPHQILLARWISQYYLSPLFDAVALFLAPGFERKTLTFISIPDAFDDSQLPALSFPQQHVFELARKLGSINLKELEKGLGKKKAQAAVSRLADKGLITRSYEIAAAKIRNKTVPYVQLNIPAMQTRAMAGELRARRAFKQAALLDFLAGQTSPVPWSEASRQTGCNKSTARNLLNKEVITFQPVVVRRQPIACQRITTDSPPKLTAVQKAALEPVVAALRQRQIQPRVFLLHGVTGSGKTEIYLRALDETIRQRQRGIVLVPEISLTPQTIERFTVRFPNRIALRHSKLSAGEQFDEWHHISKGGSDVVIGTRSAVFAPQPNLGLIVIDEEHEWNYKQTDSSPGYHARDVALKLAELTGAVVLLGSATPDLQTYDRARKGDYRLLSLPGRVVPQNNAALPQVEVVDLRDELRAGNTSLFSRSLARAITKALPRGEQVILFLNRRGGATLVQCRSCGYVFHCPRCRITLIQHITKDSLVCHQCNYKIPTPQICPRCISREIKFLGAGTQKLEQAAGLTFPKARLLRWDSDVTSAQDTHEEILSRLRNHQADILIGTQIVAKGLDLPLVTVVGVINADTILHLPDFRAVERTFQILSQVAGRAGRGVSEGRVFIQTYSPEHHAIQSAANHDYTAFFNNEIVYRRQTQLPPYTQLALLTYAHINQAHCQQEATRMAHRLAEVRDSQGTEDIRISGPAPAFIHRRRGRFRWQIILRGNEVGNFLSQISFPPGWAIDVDPVSLL